MSGSRVVIFWQDDFVVRRQIRTRAERMLGYARVLEARNPATSADRLRALADDDVRPVRVWVARNFHTPRDALERLAQDRDEAVRGCASYALTLPEIALRWRANGGQVPAAAQSNGFLHDMVHHPSVPEDLRAELLAAGHCQQRCPRRRNVITKAIDTP
ncbi:hypothetical protein [Dactylosporangium sp. NPDC048998]|uniref:hypothetical protein n=1 Tax=Dactylosporangium sp. NPDC048998 TaxID=3363976 RepID=UPI003717563C